MAVDELTEQVRGVPVVRWNPSREIGGESRPVNNFGDLIGPIVVEALLAEQDVSAPASADGRLVAVGSILQFAQRGDVVWGAGVNAKLRGRRIGSRELDVRAVRGPFTRLLLEAEGIAAPGVFGDPGLLLPTLQTVTPGARRDVLIIPNLNDLDQFAADERTLSPRAPLAEIEAAVAAAGFVTGSSLHAMVLADALGIPSRPLASQAEHPLKYADYYGGTGRPDIVAAQTVDEALALGPVPVAHWEADALRAAFPTDLWTGAARGPAGTIRPLAELVADAAALVAPGQTGTIREGLAPFVLEHVLLTAFRTRGHRVSEDDLAAAVALARPLVGEGPPPASLIHDPLMAALAAGDVRAVRLASLRRERGLRAESTALGALSAPWRLRGTVFDVGRPGDAVLRLSTQDGSMVEVPVAVHEEPDWRGGWPWEAVIEPGTVRAELVASSRTTRVTSGGGRSESAVNGLSSLSVIVTTHNAGPWIEEQLSSILRQDLHELEVVVVDDHSTDDTLDKVRQFQRRDPRVNIVSAEQPGAANARALGVASASGEYLMFASGVDVVPRGAYSALLSASASASARPDVIVGDYLTFSTGRTRRPTKGWPAFAERRDGIRLTDLPSLLRTRSLGNKVFRRTFWAESGLPQDTSDTSVIAPVTATYLAADAITVISDAVLLRRDRPGRPGPEGGSALAYLRQELGCARSVLANDDESLKQVYASTMLDSDSWSHLKRFLTVPTPTTADEPEVAALWHQLMAEAPSQTLRSASPVKQLVRALVAGGEFETARALVRSDADVHVAHELASWRSAIDTVTNHPDLAGFVDVARIARRRLVEPLLTYIHELDDTEIREHLEWLSGRDVRSERGRSLLAAFAADPDRGVRTLATAVHTIEARVDRAHWGLAKLRLSGQVSAPTREALTVLARPVGATEAVELGSVTPDAVGRWHLAIRVDCVPTKKSCAILLRVPVPGAGFASVEPTSTVTRITGFGADRRGVETTRLGDRFGLRRKRS